MDDRAYNVFTEFSRHAEDLCLHVRHQSFDDYVHHLISASLGAVEAAAAAQASALEGLEAGVGRVERGQGRLLNLSSAVLNRTEALGTAAEALEVHTLESLANERALLAHQRDQQRLFERNLERSQELGRLIHGVVGQARAWHDAFAWAKTMLAMTLAWILCRPLAAVARWFAGRNRQDVSQALRRIEARVDSVADALHHALERLEADRGADRAMLEMLQEQHGSVLAALDEAAHRAAEQGHPAARRAPRRRNAKKLDPGGAQ